MIWIIIVTLIFAGGCGYLIVSLRKKHSLNDEQLARNLAVKMEELATKKKMLSDLSKLALGLVTKEEFVALDEQLKASEEELRAEKGRLTITAAEIEAVDTRLRELEELKRELETSGLDAVRELELLRSQERNITTENEQLRSQLESSMEQLDLLIGILASSAEAVERLNSAKTQLLEVEKQTLFYQEQISLLNHKYIDLKKAYDALDIEYAQLYEKQQSS